MIGLPQSTEVRKSLPKAGLFKQFDWKPSQRESFDGDVSRLDFVNWISPRTMPAIAEGSEVREIYVVSVVLKTRSFDFKNFILLGKSIPQRIVFLLSYEGEIMLAVYHDKLFTSNWLSDADVRIPLNGLNLDSVWQNLVSYIGSFAVEEGASLSEQIQTDIERAKLEKQISDLEKRMRAERQPRRKRELYAQLMKLKGGIYGGV